MDAILEIISDLLTLHRLQNHVTIAKLTEKIPTDGGNSPKSMGIPLKPRISVFSICVGVVLKNAHKNEIINYGLTFSYFFLADFVFSFLLFSNSPF
jgi:hypothetical protein